MSDEFKCSTTNTRYEAPTAPDLIGPDGRLSFEGLENCFSLGGTDQFHRNRALRIIDADPKHRNPHPPPSHHKRPDKNNESHQHCYIVRKHRQRQHSSPRKPPDEKTSDRAENRESQRRKETLGDQL